MVKWLGESYGFADGISYHPNGMTYRTFHSNGVVDTRTADPKGMARQRKISTSGADQKVPGTALQNCGALSGIVRQSGA